MIYVLGKEDGFNLQIHQQQKSLFAAVLHNCR